VTEERVVGLGAGAEAFGYERGGTGAGQRDRYDPGQGPRVLGHEPAAGIGDRPRAPGHAH
jgi:hypothetical protein